MDLLKEERTYRWKLVAGVANKHASLPHSPISYRHTFDELRCTWSHSSLLLNETRNLETTQNQSFQLFEDSVRKRRSRWEKITWFSLIHLLCTASLKLFLLFPIGLANKDWIFIRISTLFFLINLFLT